VTSDPAPEFGIVVDEHLQVVDVAKGSAAEKAGIQRGDILKTLDNTPLTSTQQAKQLAREAVDSKTLAGQMSTLTVSRKGQEMTLHILPAPPADRGGSPDNPLPTVTPVWPPYDYF
jgi:S1-C subfamily serine protease